MAKILIVDDDKMICEALCDLFQPSGHEVSYALTLRGSLEKASGTPYDVVFLDVNLPDGNGIHAIPQFRDATSGAEVVIITGEGDPDGAELAISNNAWDYLQKPISAKSAMLLMTRVLQYRGEKQNRILPVILNREGIVGESTEINRCLELIAQASRTDANVIITGESGTGKELFARAVHANSRRKDNRLVVVDCATLPETLVESVLFGNVKGAFTGADRSREGMIKEADGGSLFLDEIAELPLEVQASFLRVLQERRFRPVGASYEVESNFRLIAATNRDLSKMVKAGSFREDLYYRLQSISIELPPLRGRKKDIQAITFHYLAKLCDRYGIGAKGLSPEFIDALSAYDWPGNIRELIHAVEKALASAGDSHTLFPVHLPQHIRSQLLRDNLKSKPTSGSTNRIYFESFPVHRELIQETEASYFKNLLHHTNGDIKKVCEISNLSRSQVYKILKKHNISKYANGS